MHFVLSTVILGEQRMKYNLINKKFGKLLVTKECGRNQKREMLWKCLCDCGNYVEVPTYRLISGKTKSCGCIRNELLLTYSDYKRESHGMAKTRLYKTWVNMRNRCNRPTERGYKNYGGRGIKVCVEWQNSFIPFMEWALSNGYDDTLTIDRIDVNGNYEPNNCRWVTQKEQNNNMTSNVRLTHKGITHNLTEWSKITGISYPTLQGRIRRGWKTEDILFKPINKRYSHSKHMKGEQG